MIPLARPIVTEEDIEAVVRALRAGRLAAGEGVRAFEEAFAAYLGARHAVAVMNGTAALHAALLAAGVGPGDKVLTTPFTFIASVNAIRHAGASPVFADVEEETLLLDPEAARRRIEEVGGVKAILLVHLYGLPCDVDAFRALAEESGALLLEDAAQAHGATFRGRRVGALGHAGAFSFYATKNVTAGEGGMIVTDDDALAERARKLINHGRSGRYAHDLLGFNYRMTDLQAALGASQLSRLDEQNARRQAIAARYQEAFSDLEELVLPSLPEGRTHVFHQYVVRTPRRDALAAHLAHSGVDSAVVYPTPVCQQPCSAGLCGCARAGEEMCARATQASREVLALPVHPALTDDEVEAVVRHVRSFFSA